MEISALKYWVDIKKAGVPEATVNAMLAAVEAKVPEGSTCEYCGSPQHVKQYCFLPVVIKAIARANVDLGTKWKEGMFDVRKANAKARSDAAKKLRDDMADKVYEVQKAHLKKGSDA